jgi:Ca2+-binding EF-hand superfamily protein
MKMHLLAVTASAFLLTCVAIPATAQQPSPMPQPNQEQTEAEPDVACGGMMGGQGMGRGMMGEMMRHGMTGHRGMMNPLAMRMIFALMNSDGDGTISLQEWQAAHEKIFKAMDADKNGTVSFEEMMNFMRGTARSAPHQ